MKKLFSTPAFIATLGATFPLPVTVPVVGGSAAIVGLMGISACAKNPGIDLSSVNLADSIRNLVRIGCGAVPIAATISDIIVAMELPAALPLEQQASIIANRLCAEIDTLKHARKAPRATITNNGTPVLDYGSVLVNGKPVHIQVETK